MADGTTKPPGTPPLMEAALPSPERKAQPRPKTRGPPLNQIYALPVPIRTFPLPSFYPNNPISLFHLVYSWVRQVFSPPPAEPSVIHTGVWDPESRSVHVTDIGAVRALWEQGFYGKGSLSRSEPNWLKREQIRRGAVEGDVSEQRTALRREERRQVKWERARTEQEALERTRREEAQFVAGGDKADAPPSVAPVVLDLQAGSELAASRSELSVVSLEVNVPQPSSNTVEGRVESLNDASEEACADVSAPTQRGTASSHTSDQGASRDVSPAAISVAPVIAEASPLSKAPVGPLELLALPNSFGELQLRSNAAAGSEGVGVGAGATVGGNSTSGQACAPKPPVGPLELLALPNSLPVKRAQPPQPSGHHVSEGTSASKLPADPLDLGSLPNGLSNLRSDVHSLSVDKTAIVNGLHGASDAHRGSATQDRGVNNVSNHGPMNKTGAGNTSAEARDHNDLNGHSHGPIFGALASGPVISDLAASKRTVAVAGGPVKQPTKRRKSVRFSTTVESTTFLHHDPPRPGRTALVEKCNGDSGPEAIPAPREAVQTRVEASAPEDQQEVKDSSLPASPETAAGQDATAGIENKEHLQLSAEEAFFLSYGIGALSILDPATKLAIPQEKLLWLFRSHSYFPPRQDLGPDDPFLVHYAVYHHFRSLGWVPRHGIKFGVDWMLYTRGPVFDHAEFGLMVIPAYSHSWWKESGVEAPRKSWHWLHGVNRVLSHVLKSLVLVYVDVPPPPVFDAAVAAGGISAALKEYKVREFMVRRWSSNRNR